MRWGAAGSESVRGAAQIRRGSVYVRRAVAKRGPGELQESAALEFVLSGRPQAETGAALGREAQLAPAIIEDLAPLEIGHGQDRGLDAVRVGHLDVDRIEETRVPE